MKISGEFRVGETVLGVGGECLSLYQTVLPPSLVPRAGPLPHCCILITVNTKLVARVGG